MSSLSLHSIETMQKNKQLNKTIVIVLRIIVWVLKKRQKKGGKWMEKKIK